MSEYQLARLFTSTAAAEKRCEESRQRLAASPSFSPYAVFDQLDTKQLKKLSITDFQSFLAESKVYVQPGDLELLVAQYDSDEDSSLTLADFCALVLPAENISLRETAEMRRSGSPSKLAKHISLECGVLRELEKAKKPLRGHLKEAFASVDTHNYGAFSIDQLRNFLRKQAFMANQEDLQRIIRRIDTDNDLRINFEDFKDFLYCRRPSSSFVPTPDSEHFQEKDFNHYEYKNTDSMGESTQLKSQHEPARIFRSSLDNWDHNNISLSIPNRQTEQKLPINHKFESFSGSKSYKGFSPSFSTNNLRKSLFSKHTPILNRQSSELYIQRDEQYRSASGMRPTSIHENPFNSKQRMNASNMRTVKKVMAPFKKQDMKYFLSGEMLSHQSEGLKEHYKTTINYYANNTDASPKIGPFSTINRRKAYSQGQFKCFRASFTTQFQSWGIYGTEEFRCGDQGVEKLIKAMKFQVKLQARVDKIKKNLAQNPDTGIIELFNESDTAKKRYLSPKDLDALLDKLGVSHTSSDIYLLIRSYSSYKDSKLCISDFENMLGSFVNRFSLTNGIKALIGSLKEFEHIRKELFVNSYLNFLEIFKALDGNKDGFLSVNDLSDHISRTEANAIVKLYDKNLDGSICYNEFIQELTPKLN